MIEKPLNSSILSTDETSLSMIVLIACKLVRSLSNSKLLQKPETRLRAISRKLGLKEVASLAFLIHNFLAIRAGFEPTTLHVMSSHARYSKVPLDFQLECPEKWIDSHLKC